MNLGLDVKYNKPNRLANTENLDKAYKVTNELLITQNNIVSSNKKVLHIIHHFHPDLQVLLESVGLHSDSDRFYQAQSSVYKHLGLSKSDLSKRPKNLIEIVDNLGIEKIAISLKVLFEEAEAFLPADLIIHHTMDGLFLEQWENQYRLLGLEPHFILLYTPIEWAVEERIQLDIAKLKANTKLIWQPMALRKFHRRLAKRQQQYLYTWRVYMQRLKDWTEKTSTSFSIMKIDDVNSKLKWEDLMKSYNFTVNPEVDLEAIPSRKQVSKYGDPEIQAIHDYFSHGAN